MSFTVSQHFLRSSGDSVPYVKANAFGSRMTPELIIVHDTAGRLDKGNTVRYLASKDAKVSAHIVIERDGSIVQMVPFDFKAFHAGVSTWNGRRGCNNFAIGIEIVNPGKLLEVSGGGKAWFGEVFPRAGVTKLTTKEHGTGLWMPYTEQQIATVIKLIEALGKSYPTIQDVTTHWCVSPGRKVDTNPLFPLDEARKALRDAKKGKKQDDGTIALGSRGEHVRLAQSRLKTLGYAVGTPDGIFGPRTKAAVLAFESENELTYDGALTVKELAVLYSENAKSMPIGEREDATIEDLKETGSNEVIAGGRIEKVGFVTAGLATAEAGSSEVMGFSPWETTVTAFDGAAEAVGKVTGLGFAIPQKFVLLILAVMLGTALIRIGRGIQWRRLAKHRLGIDLNY
jgi:N-acetyl-anhydromuramyl-L-alanine amidase AmpD